jgi:hypothetical protein
MGLAIAMGSCAALRESPKYKFNDGIYKVGILSSKHVRIVGLEDSIISVRVKRSGNEWLPDTNKTKYYPKSLGRDAHIPKPKSFYHADFDLDFLTVLAKYRPAQGILPPVLHTTTYNGGLFTGYRVDNYRLSYSQSPLHLFKRKITHYGYSIGILTGIGATPMNANVTLPAIDYEYDGFIISNGIAITAAIQNITFGIAAGEDRLMESNSKRWIYQGKPWIGLAIGLNLN